MFVKYLLYTLGLGFIRVFMYGCGGCVCVWVFMCQYMFGCVLCGKTVFVALCVLRFARLLYVAVSQPSQTQSEPHFNRTRDSPRTETPRPPYTHESHTNYINWSLRVRDFIIASICFHRFVFWKRKIEP